MKKNKISKNWINKQRRDVYVKQSIVEGYNSRAVYKLIEIDEKFKIFKNGNSIIDLGAAPGSWSQYVSKKVKHAKILSIDLLDFQRVWLGSSQSRSTKSRGSWIWKLRYGMPFGRKMKLPYKG